MTEGPLIGQAVAIGDDRQPRDVAEITAAVHEANTKLARVEQLNRFTVVDTPWAAGGDELTPAMKLKRKLIAEKYHADIKNLYRTTPGPAVIDLGVITRRDERSTVR